LKQKHQSLHRYEQSFEKNKKNFLNNLSADNKNVTEVHYKMQAFSNRTTKNHVINDLKLGSIEHGKDLLSSLERKNQKKAAMIMN